MPPIWNSAEQEMVLFIAPRGAKIDYNMDFAFEVRVGEIGDIPAQPAVPLFRAQATLVREIIKAVRETATRDGIF